MQDRLQLEVSVWSVTWGEHTLKSEHDKMSKCASDLLSVQFAERSNASLAPGKTCVRQPL